MRVADELMCIPSLVVVVAVIVTGIADAATHVAVPLLLTVATAGSDEAKTTVTWFGEIVHEFGEVV